MSPSSVNPALTRDRRRKVVENDEFGAFIGRVIRAYGRRIAGGDIEALRQLLALAQDIETATDNAVEGLRDFGYSWGEIAQRLGVSRQAVHQRWGHRDA
jgi:DNA-directed RNA polymerase specialized sigma24 family protein